jgi:hypothetical protein
MCLLLSVVAIVILAVIIWLLIKYMYKKEEVAGCPCWALHIRCYTIEMCSPLKCKNVQSFKMEDGFNAISLFVSGMVMQHVHYITS